MDHRSERILVDCVEEVAIAGGLRPPPRVLVANAAAGINAFVVGFGRRSAAVCVSRQAVDRLSREELEGVVAHEVAHIIHGDLLLITLAASGTDLLTWWRRSLALAAGGLVAFGVLRGLIGGRPSRSRLQEAAWVAWLLVIGLFMLCAWLAHLAARRSYARFRRLQEFAADAGAVRLVRTPHGLARALAKSGRTLPGTVTGQRYCHEQRRARPGPHDEHPSVEERIRRLLDGPAPWRGGRSA